MVETIKSLLCENLEQSSIFQAVKKETEEAANSLMQAIEKTVLETTSKDFACKEAMRVCQQYQIDGYLKGINEGIKLANLLSNNQIQVQDIDSGEQII